MNGLILLITLIVVMIVVLTTAFIRIKKSSRNQDQSAEATEAKNIFSSHWKILIAVTALSLAVLLIWYFSKTISNAINSVTIMDVIIFILFVIGAIALFILFRWLFENRLGLGKRITLLVVSNIAMWILAHFAIFFAWYEEVLVFWNQSSNNIIIAEILCFIVYAAGFIWSLTGPRGTIKNNRNRTSDVFHYITGAAILCAIVIIGIDISEGKDNLALKKLNSSWDIFSKIEPLYIKFQGSDTLVVTYKNGIKLPAGKYVIEILKGVVETENGQELKNGQEINLSSPVNFFSGAQKDSAIFKAKIL